MAYNAIVPIFGAFETWRGLARKFASRNVAPNDIHWSREGETPGFLDTDFKEETSSHKILKVPNGFLTLAEEVVCFAGPNGLPLLYRVLLRLQETPGLLSNPADTDVNALSGISKEVHRDCHKMKAFVRFKETGESKNARRQFAAWFEPDNFIVEHNAPFFARRFADMDWVIATPKGSAKFVSGVLSFTLDKKRPPRITDDMDELWRIYYASIFNPARLKVKSMQAHMPKKYWKNLPEAGLIPELIAGAELQAQAMRDKAPTMAPVNLHKIKAPAILIPGTDIAFPSLEEAKQGATHCQRCPLFADATQTVFGEGSQEASLMFVGEQPGDQEDMAGHPFVGPAGKIFDQALATAGIDRKKAYVTNAVKHFKFKPRGKRRIHEKPNRGEIHACGWWLKQELNFVKSPTVIAMGATALEALTGDGKGITKRRGNFEDGLEGRRLFITYHPSALLRAPDEGVAAKMRAEFFSDIAQLKKLADQS